MRSHMNRLFGLMIFATVFVFACSTLAGADVSTGTVQAQLDSLNAKSSSTRVELGVLSQATSDAMLAAGFSGTIIPADADTQGVTIARSDAAATTVRTPAKPLPVFNANVDPAATGGANALIVNSALGIEGIPADWNIMTDAERVSWLTGANWSIVYSYSDLPSASVVLVGSSGMLAWPDAVACGIVAFTPAGAEFSYAVIDGTGNPYAAGDRMIIPDSATVPTSGDKSPSGLVGGPHAGISAGCDAGLGAMTLISLLGLVLRRRK